MAFYAERRRTAMTTTARLELDFPERFSYSSSRGPVFLRSEGVSGIITLRNTESSAAVSESDILIVNLRGLVKTSITRRDTAGLYQRGGSVVYKQTVSIAFGQRCIAQLKVVRQVLDKTQKIRWSQQGDASTTGPAAKFCFARLGRSTDRCDCEQILDNVLPSPLDIVESMPSDFHNSQPRTGASVVYELRVSVIRSGRVLARRIAPIRIIDDVDATPPTAVEDFDHEYVCQVEKSLKSHVLCKVGSIAAMVNEPGPFIVRNEKQNPRTALQLKLHLQIPQKQTASHTVPSFSVDVSWQLRKSVFVSMAMHDALPTTRDASRSLLTGKAVSFGERKYCKMEVSTWQASPARSSSDQVWTSEQDLWLSLSATSLPTPTFATPYLSCRYSLSLQVKVRGNGRADLSLEVPVQIVYKSSVQRLHIRPPACSLHSLFADTDTVTDLPRYVA